MSWQVDFQTNNEVTDIKYTAGTDATHEKILSVFTVGTFVVLNCRRIKSSRRKQVSSSQRWDFKEALHLLCSDQPNKMMQTRFKTLKSTSNL